MAHRIGIMQGRLSAPVAGRFQCFPRDQWALEFERAAAAGLSSIEWIYDVFGADVNPIADDNGIESIKALIEEHGIEVRSLCADYFLDLPFLRVPEEQHAGLVEKMRWLLDRCQCLGVGHVVLPFVDASKINSKEDACAVTDLIIALLPQIEATGVELHLETSLPPEEFARLLNRVPHPLVKANYDSGNSSSLGYNVEAEFAAYGTRIGSIHIKDRILGGTTVSIGNGNADFNSLFRSLKRIGYQHDFTLQVAREIPGNEVAWARTNREFVEEQLENL